MWPMEPALSRGHLFILMSEQNHPNRLKPQRNLFERQQNFLRSQGFEQLLGPRQPPVEGLTVVM